MVFVNTKREGERVWGYLEGNGLKAAMLSGDVPQTKRLSLLKRFQDGELAVMVATDVAARGLHIPGVTHVINYDLPDDAEDYVHRIGRTARAGAAGVAISFVCESYAMGWPDIEAFIGARIPISTVEAGLLAEVDPKSRVRVERSARAGFRGDGRDGRRDAGRGHRSRRGGPGGARREGTGSGSERPSTSRRAESDHAGTSAHAAATDARPAVDASADGEQKQRRRRRPRRRPGDNQAPTPQS
jgi:ATP-dependent RNA helicase RhlB